jgi:CPA2 family monovalent cation:H+ antiporter-2
MPEFEFLRDLLLLFGLGVVVVILFHRIKLPPIVGFLITGVLCGPYGFGLIQNVHDVEALAEIGVILLLFTVGIEFSVQQLIRLRRFLFIGGGAQVLGSIALVMLLSRVIGLDWPVALFLGMIVSLSSTAIVLRTLADRGEMDTPHGGASVAILIFQDLCIVPMVLLTPFIAGGGSATSLPLVAAKALAFVGGAVIAARYIVPWLLETVVNTRQREVFLLTVILLALGAAWASAAVGLSLALGAFIAGLVISESEYSHQALGEILPLREVFNSLFFVSIGMLFDVRTILESPLVVLSAIAAVLLIKAAIAGGVTLASGRPLRVALIVGIGLAQIGEFSFVLLQSGLGAGLIATEQYDLLLAAAFLTLLATPLLVQLGPRIPWPAADPRAAAATAGTAAELERSSGHVVIVGFGLTGRHLAHVLRAAGLRYRVIEIDGRLVRSAEREGEPILFGDAARFEILEHAGVREAAMVVFAISDPAALRQGLSAARRLSPSVPIIVRTRRLRELEALRRQGADEVVSEEFETSIEIFTRVLTRLHVPRNVIRSQARLLREGTYEMMRAAPSVEADGVIARALAAGATDVFLVGQGYAAAGRSLDDLELRRRTGASVIAWVRDDRPRTEIDPKDRIEPGDSLVLVGGHAAIEKAFRLLEHGPEND